MIIKIQDSQREVMQPSNIYSLLKEFFKTQDEVDLDKEHFFVFHLDTRNKIKVLELVSIGTLNTSLVHPREVFVRAVLNRSAGLVLAHNHPSGNAEPSNEDMQITSRLVQAGSILGMEVIDHLIYTSDKYYSFKENRLI